MRPGQHQNNNKRLRGRNRGKGPNPLNRGYESNGPDVKIRGTAQHIAEKYLQLARDATASGDRVMGENYMQHAEHYFRMLAAAQAQFAPHLPAYVRPDEQQYDDDDDYEDGDSPMGAVGPDGQPLPMPQPQMPSNNGYEPREPRDQRDQRQHGGNGGGYQQREPREQRGEFRQRNNDRPYDRRDRDFRDRNDRDQRPPLPQGERAERADMGEQPAVDFPLPRREERFAERPERAERSERPERGPRGERGPRADRPPRERAPAPVEADSIDGVEGDAPMPAMAAPEAPAFADEGREPGLPSFLTRTRRRGRPAYRRRDGEDAEAADGGDEAPPAPAPTVNSGE